MNGRKRIETKASRTASYTCFARGCATREKNPRFRGPDDLAEAMFPAWARMALGFPPARAFLMRRMFPPGIYEYVSARTKVMDAAFADALDAGFAQIILLGAGFDTRALRFAGRNRGTKVIELDAAGTQRPKIEILRRKKIPLPENLVFAPIDFDTQDLGEILSAAGFQAEGRNLFLWEGVTMYLTAAAVDGTLSVIRSRSASGSRVVFDYLYAAVLRRENRYYGERGIFDTVHQTGEGWTFGLEEEAVGPFLAERGFTLTTHYTPSDLEKLFWTEEDGALHGRVNGTHCIAVAEVR